MHHLQELQNVRGPHPLQLLRHGIHTLHGRHGSIPNSGNQKPIRHVHGQWIVKYNLLFLWGIISLGILTFLGMTHPYSTEAWHKMRRMVWYANVGKLKRSLRPLSESRPSFRRGGEELRHSGKVPERYLGIVRASFRLKLNTLKIYRVTHWVGSSGYQQGSYSISQLPCRTSLQASGQNARWHPWMRLPLPHTGRRIHGTLRTVWPDALNTFNQK